MDTHLATPDVIEPVRTLRELAARLSVSVQTLYDLRSKGRGPRGFRVRRELRLRQSEVDAWLARHEAADADLCGEWPQYPKKLLEFGLGESLARRRCQVVGHVVDRSLGPVTSDGEGSCGVDETTVSESGAETCTPDFGTGLPSGVWRPC